MLVILVKGTIQEGQADAVRDMMQYVRNEFVLQEEGCHQYDAYVEGHTLCIIEQWRDEAALGAHIATPHMQTYLPKLKAAMTDNSLYAQVIQSDQIQTQIL